MNKTILDTNVLIADANLLEADDIVLPLVVLEELEKLRSTVPGAREALRVVARRQSEIEILADVRLRPGTDPDSLIIAACIDRGCDLVTADVPMAIRARARGVTVSLYEDRAVIPPLIDEPMSADDLSSLCYKGALNRPAMDHCAHASVRCVSPTGTALARVSASRNNLIRVDSRAVMGIRSRNAGQHFAVAALMDPTIELVILIGRAGTGKTLLAMAAGIEQLTQYATVSVARPIVPMGNELGYLPGSLDEKLSPWMAPIHDSLDFIYQKNPARREELVASGALQVEALTYIRGRSLPGTWLVIDEAQNLSPHEMKTIITRMGEGSKLIVTGDPGQIDEPGLTSRHNGLSVAARAFKGHPLAMTVYLESVERSRLAEAGAALL